MKIMRMITVVPRLLGVSILAIVQYVMMVAALVLCFVVFRILNRTTVIRIKNTRLTPNTVIISNHQSLLDSFLVGSVLGSPQLLRQPWLMPWHLADKKNFFSHPLLKHAYRLLRVIPVQSDLNGVRKDLKAFQEARRVLRKGTVHIFAEGTRSPDETLLPFKPAAAAIPLLAKAKVRPVYFTGMHTVQPYRKAPGDGPRTWLRIFGKRTEWLLRFRIGQRIWINVGPDVPYRELAEIAGRGRLRDRCERVAEALRLKLVWYKVETNCTRSASP